MRGACTVLYRPRALECYSVGHVCVPVSASAAIWETTSFGLLCRCSLASRLSVSVSSHLPFAFHARAGVIAPFLACSLATTSTQYADPGPMPAGRRVQAALQRTAQTVHRGAETHVLGGVCRRRRCPAAATTSGGIGCPWWYSTGVHGGCGRGIVSYNGTRAWAQCADRGRERSTAPASGPLPVPPFFAGLASQSVAPVLSDSFAPFSFCLSLALVDGRKRKRRRRGARAGGHCLGRGRSACPYHSLLLCFCCQWRFRADGGHAHVPA
ncbi:hypothetical protein DFH06DRAFT_107154 [Mycena polygramma]|nr:hypothetical protein DFH06DRAFT_107154 [Mycena polygramma]